MKFIQHLSYPILRRTAKNPRTTSKTMHAPVSVINVTVHHCKIKKEKKENTPQVWLVCVAGFITWGLTWDHSFSVFHLSKPHAQCGRPGCDLASTLLPNDLATLQSIRQPWTSL